MTKWVFKGLKTGIKTTSYPKKPETAEGVSPGRPDARNMKSRMNFEAITSSCPTGALSVSGRQISVDRRRCIDCFACNRLRQNPISRDNTYKWAGFTKKGKPLARAFSHSIHIRMVDAGACSACLSEIKLIGSAYYNIHRLGFFITPTPRNADVLLVAGPLTEHMRLGLEKTHDAMATPNVVMAVGTCALSGGVFGPGFASKAGIGETIAVDIEIPGCPPPPLAVIHGLLLASGRLTANYGEKR